MSSKPLNPTALILAKNFVQFECVSEIITVECYNKYFPREKRVVILGSANSAFDLTDYGLSLKIAHIQVQDPEIKKDENQGN